MEFGRWRRLFVPKLFLIFFLQSSFLFLAGHNLLAFEPNEVAVLANANLAASKELARHYMKLRGIPSKHLILVNTAAREICSRTAYREEIAGPVKKAVERLRSKKNIRCLVTIHGIPLKIASTMEEERDQKYRQQLIAQKKQLIKERDQASAPLQEVYEKRIAKKEQEIDFIEITDSRAAVDSELALVLAGNYPLDGWQPNPFYPGFRHKSLSYSTNEVLMVARLDGPDEKAVLRVLTDTLKAEEKGLSGSVCIDARWPESPGEKGGAYQLYDQSLHRAAGLLKNAGWNVRLNQSPQLFGAKECEDTALYAGWYSLGNYVDAFSWAQGAIGFHIASAECRTLRDQTSNTWCLKMMEDGVAATLGPVYEPYLQAFPLPEHFFSQLVEGYLSLGEVYLVSQPYLSWQMVLVGDPLYRPFNKGKLVAKEKKEN